MFFRQLVVRVLAFTTGFGAISVAFGGVFLPSVAIATDSKIIHVQPIHVAVLGKSSYTTSANDLGDEITTNYAIYCQPQDIPQDRPICLGGIGGEVDTDVPPTESASELNGELELAGQDNPLAQIELYQYDKVQIFPLR